MSYLDYMERHSTGPQSLHEIVSEARGHNLTIPVRSANDYAARVNAFVNREIYTDYQNRFEPFEDQLIDAVRGEELLNERLNAIHNNYEKSTLVGRQAAERRLSRFGVQQDARQRQASNTAQSLNQSAAMAAAQNQTRRHINDRNTALIAGGNTRQAINLGN